ncbi:hypothetical protein ADUPG1_000340 [Aduncisulcus paluster]|uniref:Uncharacterized protein n=1 Tax=Aduncisulcus paluster TaxID=2918883 RepID=A0ABQ5K9I1_9EUKA|nr:hypothetical protein ADUPG1_000340 [Aduncisulcus paluster]
MFLLNGQIFKDRLLRIAKIAGPPDNFFIINGCHSPRLLNALVLGVCGHELTSTALPASYQFLERSVIVLSPLNQLYFFLPCANHIAFLAPLIPFFDIKIAVYQMEEGESLDPFIGIDYFSEDTSLSQFLQFFKIIAAPCYGMDDKIKETAGKSQIYLEDCTSEVDHALDILYDDYVVEKAKSDMKSINSRIYEAYKVLSVSLNSDKPFHDCVRSGLPLISTKLSSPFLVIHDDKEIGFCKPGSATVCHTSGDNSIIESVVLDCSHPHLPIRASSTALCLSNPSVFKGNEVEVDSILRTLRETLLAMEGIVCEGLPKRPKMDENGVLIGSSDSFSHFHEMSKRSLKDDIVSRIRSPISGVQLVKLAIPEELKEKEEEEYDGDRFQLNIVDFSDPSKKVTSMHVSLKGSVSPVPSISKSKKEFVSSASSCMNISSKGEFVFKQLECVAQFDLMGHSHSLRLSVGHTYLVPHPWISTYSSLAAAEFPSAFSPSVRSSLLPVLFHNTPTSLIDCSAVGKRLVITSEPLSPNIVECMCSFGCDGRHCMEGWMESSSHSPYMGSQEKLMSSLCFSRCAIVLYSTHILLSPISQPPILLPLSGTSIWFKEDQLDVDRKCERIKLMLCVDNIANVRNVNGQRMQTVFIEVCDVDSCTSFITHCKRALKTHAKTWIEAGSGLKKIEEEESEDHVSKRKSCANVFLHCSSFGALSSSLSICRGICIGCEKESIVSRVVCTVDGARDQNFLSEASDPDTDICVYVMLPSRTVDGFAVYSNIFETPSHNDTHVLVHHTQVGMDSEEEADEIASMIQKIKDKCKKEEIPEVFDSFSTLPLHQRVRNPSMSLFRAGLGCPAQMFPSLRGIDVFVSPLVSGSAKYILKHNKDIIKILPSSSSTLFEPKHSTNLLLGEHIMSIALDKKKEFLDQSHALPSRPPQSIVPGSSSCTSLSIDPSMEYSVFILPSSLSCSPQYLRSEMKAFLSSHPKVQFLSIPHKDDHGNTMNIGGYRKYIGNSEKVCVSSWGGDALINPYMLSPDSSLGSKTKMSDKFTPPLRLLSCVVMCGESTGIKELLDSLSESSEQRHEQKMRMKELAEVRKKGRDNRYVYKPSSNIIDKLKSVVGAGIGIHEGDLDLMEPPFTYYWSDYAKDHKEDGLSRDWLYIGDGYMDMTGVRSSVRPDWEEVLKKIAIADIKSQLTSKAK